MGDETISGEGSAQPMKAALIVNRGCIKNERIHSLSQFSSAPRLLMLPSDRNHWEDD